MPENTATLEWNNRMMRRTNRYRELSKLRKGELAAVLAKRKQYIYGAPHTKEALIDAILEAEEPLS